MRSLSMLVYTLLNAVLAADETDLADAGKIQGDRGARRCCGWSEIAQTERKGA